MTNAVKPGRVLLAEFLERNKITIREAAKGVRVSHPAIVQWIDGTAKPSAPHREAIDRWSAGAVPAESWLEPHEAERLGEVVPWERPPVTAEEPPHPEASEIREASAEPEVAFPDPNPATGTDGVR